MNDDDGLGAARGLVFGLILSVAFWGAIGVVYLGFRLAWA